MLTETPDQHKDPTERAGALQRAIRLLEEGHWNAALALIRPLLLHMKTRSDALLWGARCFESAGNYAKARHLLNRLVVETPSYASELALFNTRVSNLTESRTLSRPWLTFACIALVAGGTLSFASFRGNPVSELLWLFGDVSLTEHTIVSLSIASSLLLFSAAVLLWCIIVYCRHHWLAMRLQRNYAPLFQRNCWACGLVTRSFRPCDFCDASRSMLRPYKPTALPSNGTITPWQPRRDSVEGKCLIEGREWQYRKYTGPMKAAVWFGFGLICLLGAEIVAKVHAGSNKQSISATMAPRINRTMAATGEAADKPVASPTGGESRPTPGLIALQEGVYWDVISKLKATGIRVVTDQQGVPSNWPGVEQAYMKRVSNHTVTIHEVGKTTEVRLTNPCSAMRFFTSDFAGLSFFVRQSHNSAPANWACYFVYFIYDGGVYRTSIKQMAGGKYAKDLGKLEGPTYPVLPDYEGTGQEEALTKK